MSLRTIATLAVAVLLGLVAVFVARGVIGGGRAAAPALASGGQPVVVAAHAIQKGAVLQPAMVKVAAFPAGGAPQGSFASIDQLLPAAGEPKVALRDVAAGEPVLSSRVSGPGGRPNLAANLKPGMRAVSVRSSDVAGVGGFVLPGDRVDILVTREVGAENKSNIVQVLAENVRVLGVDQQSDADKPVVAKAVTVEVTAEQAQAISLAQAVGEVSLALRQFDDNTPVGRRTMTVAELGGGAPRAAGGVAAPRRSRPAAGRPASEVRVTRGVEVSGYAVP